MIVRVDLTTSPAAVTLESPGDCASFHLAVAGSHDPSHLAAALTAAGMGEAAAEDHVWVAVDAVRALAAGQVGAEWDDEFAAMVAFASTKGWLSPAGDAISAHVEWPS